MFEQVGIMRAYMEASFQNGVNVFHLKDFFSGLSQRAMSSFSSLTKVGIWCQDNYP